MARISPKDLRTLVRYEPSTGKLFWRSRGAEWFEVSDNRRPEHAAAIWNARYAGEEAFSTVDSEGRKYGSLLGLTLRANVVAWAVYYGEWPSKMVDHRSRDNGDNRISNLRLASNKENSRNARSRGGASRFKGVAWHKKARKWMASITIDRRTKYLGLHKSESDAAKAYDIAAIRHFGEFAATNKSLNIFEEIK